MPRTPQAAFSLAATQTTPGVSNLPFSHTRFTPANTFEEPAELTFAGLAEGQLRWPCFFFFFSQWSGYAEEKH